MRRLHVTVVALVRLLALAGGAGMGAPGAPGAGARGGPPPGVIQITPEEKASVDRVSAGGAVARLHELTPREQLQALGFSRHKALEAFLICDKNEQLAANYLFDHQFDDEAAMGAGAPRGGGSGQQ